MSFLLLQNVFAITKPPSVVIILHLEVLLLSVFYNSIYQAWISLYSILKNLHIESRHTKQYPQALNLSPLLAGTFTQWERTDLNHRSESQQIYSLPPLATRELSQNKAGGRIRTPDLLITNQLLYQLSYTSTTKIFAVKILQDSRQLLHDITTSGDLSTTNFAYPKSLVSH